MAHNQVLDIGCGIKKFPGAVGIDRLANTAADIVWDLDQFPWPVEAASFDQARMIHVVEHVGDVMRTMEEVHRLLKPGGTVLIETPHYTDFSSWCDPTHRWHLNSFSFRYFTPDDAGFGYYSAVRFKEVQVRVRLLALWRYLGFEFLVNHSRAFRKFWEFYLCFVIRGKSLHFVLEKL